MHVITSHDDPRIAPYQNLRDRTLRGEYLFIAEGTLVVRRLIESDYAVESIFATEDQARELTQLVTNDIPIYVADQSVMVDIIGFPFHRGVLAVGRRRNSPALEQVMGPLEQKMRLTLVVCPETSQAENLGMVFRSAAAFGVDAVILGPQTCDPLCRRALRTSMGGVLHIPFVQSADLADDLKTLRDRYSLHMAATVLSDDAESLPHVVWRDRVGLMLGNEFHGLSDQWLALCEHKVTIPMASSTDSLNLGVAAGVFIYERMRSVLGS